MVAACGNITLTADGEFGEVHTKKEVELTAESGACSDKGDISLAAGEHGLVLVEEANIFTADDDITLEVGDEGYHKAPIPMRQAPKSIW